MKNNFLYIFFTQFVHYLFFHQILLTPFPIPPPASFNCPCSSSTPLFLQSISLFVLSTFPSVLCSYILHCSFFLLTLLIFPATLSASSLPSHTLFLHHLIRF